MSNYNSLKATINANIKTNNNQEITGTILNSVLNAMVNTLGAGYQFAGVATTATDPGTPDAKVFYIANGKGTYTNFGDLVVTEADVVVLYWDSSWHKVSTGIAYQEKLSEIEKKTEVLVYHNNCLIDTATNFDQGYLDNEGVFVPTTGANRMKTTDFVLVDNSEVYKVDFLGHTDSTQTTSVRAICFYDSAKQYVGRASLPSGQDRLDIPQEASYIRLNVNVDVIDDLALYPLSEGRQNDVQLLDSVHYERLNELEERVSIIETNNEEIETKVELTIGIKDPNIATLDNTTFLQGYLDANGSFIPTTNTQKTSDFIEVESGKVYEIDATGHTGQSTVTMRFVGVYDSEKQFVRKLSIPTELTFGVREGEKYVRANINADVIDIFNLRIKDEDIKTFIQDNVEYERLTIAENKLKTIWQGGYIHPRRATIAFIIDGYYEFNQNRIDIFEKHGIKVGIAPQYTAFLDRALVEAIDEIRTCLGWQKKGHEILAHLNYILNEETAIDDATAKGYIREAQRVMANKGLVVSGAIGSSGEVAERFIPTIKQCFDYAATLNNHAGSAVAIHTYETSDAYRLWRYSLQISTPEQQREAVDAAIENNALLLFYGHAQSTTDYFSDENLESLLSYIDTKKVDFLCQVKTPFDAITDFFSMRKEDLQNE